MISVLPQITAGLGIKAVQPVGNLALMTAITIALKLLFH